MIRTPAFSRKGVIYELAGSEGGEDVVCQAGRQWKLQLGYLLKHARSSL